MFGVDSLDSIHDLKRDAEDGREFRAFARTEFVKWHRLNNREAPQAEIETLADKLTAKEMIRLARVDKERFHEIIPNGKQVTQFAAVEDKREELEPVALEQIFAAVKDK
jgi:hypothetical protein